MYYLIFKWIWMSILILHAKIVSCILPTAEHGARQRTLHYQGPKTWNDLPHDMKTLRFSLFKRNIKNYILNQ